MKQGIKLGLSAVGTYVMTMICSTVIFLSINQMWQWVQWTLNFILVVSMMAILYGNAARDGEHAVAMSEILDRFAGQGKQAPEELMGKGFDPRTAVVAYLVMALPLLAFAGADIVSQPYYPRALTASEQKLQDEKIEQWMQAEENGIDTLTDGEREELFGPSSPVNPFDVTARVVFMTIASVYPVFQSGLVYVFLIAALIFPVPLVVGYMQGPAVRRKKLEALAAGNKKRKPKKKTTGNNRVAKPPKVEV